VKLYASLQYNNCNKNALRHGSHSFTCNITPCLPLPLKRSPDGVTTDLWWRPSNRSLLLIYRPRKAERLSWLSWLTYSGRFTHISSHQSAVGRAQDGESLPVKDRRSTMYRATQPTNLLLNSQSSIWKTDGWKNRLIFGLAELSRKLKKSAKIWLITKIVRLKFGWLQTISAEPAVEPKLKRLPTWMMYLLLSVSLMLQNLRPSVITRSFEITRIIHFK